MKLAYSIACSWILVAVTIAQEKPLLQPFVTDVLRARVVAVVPYSQAQAADGSQENERARLDVQNALVKWGMYQVTKDPSVADLIFVVRKGRARSTTVDNGRTPGVIFYPNDSGITIGTRRGQTPPLSRTDPSPGQTQQRVGQEAGSVEDRLEVYLGGTPRIDDASRNKTPYPLDEPPIWSYTAKDGLKAPGMEAVDKFREAVEAAQKKQP